MSVHLKIKQQINKFIDAERKYKQLDQLREEKIEQVLNQAKQKENLSLVEVNAITEEINNLSRLHGFPLRKQVTKAMVYEFITRK